MNKIFLIIKREYLSRVQKLSFIVMTILAPILLAGVMMIPIWLATLESEKLKIEVIDESYIFKNIIPDKKNIAFEYPEISFNEAQEQFYSSDYDAILYVPHNILSGGKTVKIFHKSPLSDGATQYIETTFASITKNLILAKFNINRHAIKSAESNSKIKVISQKLEQNGTGKQADAGVALAVGIGAGVLIYMFIFLYGIQVMRGVMEEKTNRIVEVILSSVKPFHFMMGKIIGVALVGLTQFVLWSALTASLYTVGTNTLFKNVEINQIQQKEEIIKIGADLRYEEMNAISEPNAITKIWNELQIIDLSVILSFFLFYFLIGYFMYSALFAAIGSAVDSESDTQQFVLPITIPLLFSFVIAQHVLQNPDGSAAFWFSILPFTSPIIMMLRLPFGVPTTDIILSMCLLIIGFITTTWVAARIYRTGILMYGKKTSWKEIAKWFFYKK